MRWTPGNHFYLRNDGDTAWVDATAASQQNNQCRLDVPASSSVGNGQTLIVDFGLTFLASFGAGSKNVYLTTTTQQFGTSAWRLGGTWTVDI